MKEKPNKEGEGLDVSDRHTVTGPVVWSLCRAVRGGPLSPNLPVEGPVTPPRWSFGVGVGEMGQGGRKD